MAEINWEVDNRDCKTTWLQLYKKEGKHINGYNMGHIELTLKDLFELIENMIDNAVP